MTALADRIRLVRADIAIATRRGTKRAHLHRRHFVLVAEQIRSELAADLPAGRRRPSRAAAPEANLVPDVPAETVVPVGAVPRPDTDSPAIADPGGADAFTDIGYRQRVRI
jgi:hypothetical protein